MQNESHVFEKAGLPGTVVSPMDYPVQAPPPALAICQRWTEDKPQRPVEYVPKWNLLYDYRDLSCAHRASTCGNL